MFIKKILIEKNDGEIIREIPFHMGLNLILDNTPKEDKISSGNDVGKTTLLKLIDFCLGGDGKNIYKDNEFGETEDGTYTIKDFLIKNKVLITLILTDNLNDNKSNNIIIRRNFLSNKEKICTINNKDVNYSSKNDESNAGLLLNKLIFNYDYNKPSFRQIISKNIRYEKVRLENIVKVLHPATKSTEYEALYLFWFGIHSNSLQEKTQLKSQKDLEEKLQSRLEKDGSLAVLEQKLHLKNKEIKEKEKLKDNLNINENYKEDLNKLDNIKRNINRLNTDISALNMRKNLIIESKNELENNKVNIDIEYIKYLYEEAKKFVPNIHKSFDDTLKFHNSMIVNKISFITKELPDLESKIINLELELNELLKEEKHYANILKKSSTVEELNIIINELNILYEDRGVLESKLSMWKDSNSNINEINERLKTIEEENLSYSDLISKKIMDFNNIFSEVSYKLYGEKLILTLEEKEDKSKVKNYTINIIPYENKPSGSGRKITQIEAFDLSYIKFADMNNIKCLHFILLDEMEKVHNNQINNLVLDVLNNINCQYIISVLKDKLPPEIDVDKYTILSLSQDDKLFKF
ncbi:DUF2326 domain-containing protein [Brachyspira pilosicoli]|uniref:DUF2326 domain-containing protein n=1 Tax=Brachyspira pilosicoli TaxID=52584 RepID=UPI002543E077|nr:DUF2326 domain-containing protein [Brachyspira pilosicoli]WIH86306.1 DUF2326 domain-containing protein [Brachyspira pilosicoli]